MEKKKIGRFVPHQVCSIYLRNLIKLAQNSRIQSFWRHKMKKEIFKALRLNRIAENIELELIELFLKHGYSRNSIEIVSCWESTNKILFEGLAGLRLKLMLRPGIQKICEEILYQDTKLTIKRRKMLKDELLG